MMIDPRAGQIATETDLVDVPKLIAAYYEERPDPDIAEQRVIFGTSGHRGSSFTKTFNEWHILAITQAIVLYRKQQKIEGPLFLGIDTHALSRPAVDSALEVLAANGVDVMLAGPEEYTPTPVISHAILTFNRGRNAGFADGIVITPSHNPPDTGGFKYNPPHGGPAEEKITAWIEARANVFLADLMGVQRTPFDKAIAAPTTHRHDFLTAYVDDLHNVVDMDAIRASGISIGVNPLNISELDGWWAEAYTPKVGWAVGDGKEHGEDSAWDALEVESLYALLEQQVVPEFYNRDAEGIPSKWLERVRESMATLTPEFSASRAIREYTNHHYIPAAVDYTARTANGGKLSIDLMQWQQSVAQGWDTLRFGEVNVETKDGEYVFHIPVVPGRLHPDQFTVELYAAPLEGIGAKPEILAACNSSAEMSGRVVYSVCCPARRPATDYTARLVPSHSGASIPLEAPQMLWQR